MTNSLTRVARIAATGTAAAAATTGLVNLAAAGPAAAQATPCVQKIAVVNNAGFVMSYAVTTRVGQLTSSTDQYPINQWRILDLTSTALTTGDDVRPVVQAVAGGTALGNNFVSYCANGQTATYTVTGTTTNFQVTLLT